MVVDPKYRYSNEAERDICDDFKLQEPFGLHVLYINTSVL